MERVHRVFQAAQRGRLDMIDLDRITPPDRRGNYLLAVRIDNARAIEAAYGSAALSAALDHVRAGLRAQIETAEIVETRAAGLTATAHAPLLGPEFPRQQADALCMAIGTAPLRFGRARILLSVSAGYSDPFEVGAEGHYAQGRRLAHRRLEGSRAPARAVLPCNPGDEARYREDMQLAAQLIERHRAGETFFAWRPIFSPDDPGVVLRHEALLRYAGERGEQFDCGRYYRALTRLGLAHLLDRLLVTRVLDELAADADAELSLEISMQSLSFDLNGQDSAWTELMARLEHRPDLAARLVLEVHEGTARAAREDILTFLGVFRALGGRLALSGFGSCSASIREVARLRPDTLKLDSAFLRTAASSGPNRARFADLAGLARSLAATVIADGAETPDQWAIVAEQGVRWIAAARRNRASTRRGWAAARPASPAPERLAPLNPMPLPAHATGISALTVLLTSQKGTGHER